MHANQYNFIYDNWQTIILIQMQQSLSTCLSSFSNDPLTISIASYNAHQLGHWYQLLWLSTSSMPCFLPSANMWWCQAGWCWLHIAVIHSLLKAKQQVDNHILTDGLDFSDKGPLSVSSPTWRTAIGSSEGMIPFLFGVRILAIC